MLQCCAGGYLGQVGVIPSWADFRLRVRSHAFASGSPPRESDGRPAHACLFQAFFYLQFLQPFLTQVSGEYPIPAQSSMDASSPCGAASSGASTGSPAPPRTASAVLLSLASGTPSGRPSTGVSKDIENLLERQRQVRTQRAEVAKDLKNAQRRRQRLKHKARLLTAADLASVLVLRQEEEGAKQSSTKRRRRTQPSQGAGEDSVNEDTTEPATESHASGGDDDQPELAAGSTSVIQEEEREAA